jgi:hypothetical protein
MPNTLLVVDGRGHPRPLTERLGALGYVCLYARGPLRARTLLSQHTVDLILWKDNTGNGDLSAEFMEEWARHPRVPVVRLFGPGGATPEGVSPDRFARAIVANVPADLPESQLFTTLSRCLTGGLVAAEQQPGNELAFRHVVGSLRVHPTGQPSPAAGVLPDPAGPHTALSAIERELLREAQARVARAGAKLTQPLWRVWNRWVGAWGTRSAS